MNNCLIVFILLLQVALIATQSRNDRLVEADSSSEDSCEIKCQDRRDAAACLSDCESERNIIIGIVVPSFVIGVLSICCYRRYIRRKQSQNQRSTIIVELEQELHPLSENQQDVDRQVAQLKLNSWEFTFEQSSKVQYATQFHWDFKQTEVIGKQEFIGWASDTYGEWDCQGTLQFCIDGQIDLQMLKDYKNKSKAGQTGKLKHLIYQGTYDQELKQFTGIWYYQGFKGDADLSGPWSLKQSSHQYTMN